MLSWRVVSVKINEKICDITFYQPTLVYPEHRINGQSLITWHAPIPGNHIPSLWRKKMLVALEIMCLSQFNKNKGTMAQWESQICHHITQSLGRSFFRALILITEYVRAQAACVRCDVIKLMINCYCCNVCFTLVEISCDVITGNTEVFTF